MVPKDTAITSVCLEEKITKTYIFRTMYRFMRSTEFGYFVIKRFKNLAKAL